MIASEEKKCTNDTSSDDEKSKAEETGTNSNTQPGTNEESPNNEIDDDYIVPANGRPSKAFTYDSKIGNYFKNLLLERFKKEQRSTDQDTLEIFLEN